MVYVSCKVCVSYKVYVSYLKGSGNFVLDPLKKSLT